MPGRTQKRQRTGTFWRALRSKDWASLQWLHSLGTIFALEQSTANQVQTFSGLREAVPGGAWVASVSGYRGFSAGFWDCSRRYRVEGSGYWDCTAWVGLECFFGEGFVGEQGLGRTWCHTFYAFQRLSSSSQELPVAVTETQMCSHKDILRSGLQRRPQRRELCIGREHIHVAAQLGRHFVGGRFRGTIGLRFWAGRFGYSRAKSIATPSVRAFSRPKVTSVKTSKRRSRSLPQQRKALFTTLC